MIHPGMSSDDQLLARVREEYREMPGLQLTVAQACRLWQLDDATCRMLLERLVIEHYLRRRSDGAYAMMPSIRPKPAKADWFPDSVGVSTRRRA